MRGQAPYDDAVDAASHAADRRLNTVQYRVRKAEEAVGHPIQDRRADVELALRVCQVLGSAALRPPSG